MRLLDTIKDVYHWHVRGRCRKHNRALDIVPDLDKLPGGFDERFACTECEPELAAQALDKNIYG